MRFSFFIESSGVGSTGNTVEIQNYGDSTVVASTAPSGGELTITDSGNGMYYVDSLPLGRYKMEVDAVVETEFADFTILNEDVMMHLLDSTKHFTTVSADELETDAVITAKIQDGTVTNAKLATGIDASKVTISTLPTSVIPELGTSNIANDAVTGAKIADNVVDESKLDYSAIASGEPDFFSFLGIHANDLKTLPIQFGNGIQTVESTNASDIVTSYQIKVDSAWVTSQVVAKLDSAQADIEVLDANYYNNPTDSNDFGGTDTAKTLLTKYGHDGSSTIHSTGTAFLHKSIDVQKNPRRHQLGFYFTGATTNASLTYTITITVGTLTVNSGALNNTSDETKALFIDISSLTDYTPYTAEITVELGGAIGTNQYVTIKNDTLMAMQKNTQFDGLNENPTL